jgi:hypothetical protein
MSKRRKRPAEKKALAYKKDHVLSVEYPNAFRSYWPRRKAQASQKERRQVRRLLADLVPEHNAEARADIPLRPVRRDRVRKWPGSTIPLGKWIERRRYLRIYRTAWNFFKTPYNPDSHKARFIAFLTEITQERTSYTAQVAHLFRDLLNPPEHSSEAKYAGPYDRRSAWLHAFVADEPAWGERLHTWIAENTE